jgi:predicted glycosyltransferase
VGARAVVVPRAEPRREQLLRATAFEQLGLVSMVPPDALAPATLARRVAEALGEAEGSPRSGASAALAAFTASGALGGLDATTHAIVELLEQTTPASARVS